MPTADYQALLQHSGQLLVDKFAWQVICGPPSGSIFTLDFGKPVPDPKPSWHCPAGSSDEQTYSGEYVLFVKLAAWRVEQRGQVICTCLDDNSNGGTMERGLNKLLHRRVESVACNTHPYDLTIQFEDNLMLRVFCIAPLNAGDDYSFGHKLGHTSEWIKVGPFGELSVE